MMVKRISFILLFVFFFIANTMLAQALRITPTPITFVAPTLTTKTDSIKFDITNLSCAVTSVYYVTCKETAFSLMDTTGFLLNSQETKSLWVRFSPRQNIEYNSVVIFHTNAGDFGLPVKGYGKFTESYYDSTYNKFDEQLKGTLTNIIGANYQSFSYNAARDKMFMEFDNKKVNGQGATQNTLECIYTGRQAIGYTSRSDCQTNDNFNTEHTWPQSLFGSNTPMVSDLNHLFPTDEAANSYRGNNPFGMVGSPSWTSGGSKGISNLFEPRDAQKGRTARAMLYFAIRYNNPSYGLVTFFGPQESILRTWCLQFPPDAIDRKRNDDIFGYQKNRNPFIDHPELLERITSIATNSVAPVKSLLWCDTQKLDKRAFVYDSINYKVIVYNSGNTAITFSKIVCLQNLMAVSAPVITCAKQSSIEISLNKYLQNTNVIIDTLLIENSSTNFSTIKIPMLWNISVHKVNASKTSLLANNDSAVLNIASGGSINWNTGASGNTIIVKNAGIYFATVTDSLGCHLTDSVTITKSGNGINQMLKQKVQVHPNPAQSIIYLNHTTNVAMNYTLLNSLGQVVLSVKASEPELVQIDISGFPSGIYYLQNENGAGVKVVLK